MIYGHVKSDDDDETTSSSRVYFPWQTPPKEQKVTIIGQVQKAKEEQKIEDTRRVIPVVNISRSTGPSSSDASRASRYPNIVYVAFFPTIDGVTSTRTSAVDWIERWFMHYVSPRFQHCQLMFSWNRGDKEMCTTFSTTMQRPSDFTSSTYTRKGWVCMSLVLSQSQINALFDWCDARRNIPFNTFAYYWNFLPCVPRFCMYNSGGSSYFCAEQVASALQAINVTGMESIEPCSCTPDTLHAKLAALCEIGQACVTIIGFKFMDRADFTSAALVTNQFMDEGTSSNRRETFPEIYARENDSSTGRPDVQSAIAKTTTWNKQR